MKGTNLITRRIFAVGTWSILITSVFLFSSAAGNPSAAASDPAIQGGAEIYASNCAKCHGGDGRARTARGKRAGATDFTSDWNTDQARGIRIITNGKSEMPSFKSKLSAAQIKAVFGYVVRFKH